MKNFLASILCFFGCLFAVNVSAQNLINNGHFDTGITGWDFNSNNANWVSDDGASISGNGSFRFGLVLENNAFRWSGTDSIPVQAGHTYVLGMSVKVPAASPTNFVGMTVYWYAVDDSLISQDYIFNDIVPLPSDVWEDLYGAFAAPAESAYAVVWLTLSVGGDGSPDEAFALWDDVFMLDDTLFNADFESCHSSFHKSLQAIGCK